MKKNTKEKKCSDLNFFFVILLFILPVSGGLMAQTKPWAVPKEANNLKNPFAGNNEILKPAKLLYTSYCVACHGNKGKGDGVAAAGLATKPADHSSQFVQKQTDGALYWMITQGRNPMPSYKIAFTDNQRWQLVSYIRTLGKPAIVVKKEKPMLVKPLAAKKLNPAKDTTEKTMVKNDTPKADIIKNDLTKSDTTKEFSAKADTTITSIAKQDIVITGDTGAKEPEPPQKTKSSVGQNKFVVLGNAEATYTATKGASSFGDVNFKPIFLWKISDKLFAEAEVEIETGDGEVNVGLEYANMCYIVNPYLILHAGRFLPKFGAYRGRMGEGFINRFAGKPAGFGDGGIGAMNETGVGAEGGLPFGDIKINYDLYISNGPQLLTDPENAGQFEYEAYTSNNKFSAIGGRVAILPFQNSSLELGYSFQSKSKTGEVGTPYQNVGVTMQAVDINYFQNIPAIKSTVRFIGELKHQKVGTAIYKNFDSTDFTFTDAPTAYYASATIRPSLVENKFLRNLELAGRYSYFKRPADAPWGGTNISQFEMALDYWLKWNCVVKFCYLKQKNIFSIFNAQVVFGF